MSGQIPPVTVNDPQISFDPRSPAFIGNLSIVVHAKNATGTRLACANIFSEAQLAEIVRQNQTQGSATTSTRTSTSTATTTHSGGSSPTDPPKGDASTVSRDSWLNLLAAVFALFTVA